MSKIVDRTLDFIELFAEHKRPLSLSDITRLLNIPGSSCHDLLQALQARGFIYEIGPRAGFYPTMRLHNLVSIIAAHDPIIQRVEARLRILRDQLDESISLARVNGLRATYLLVFEPSHPLRFLVKVGEDVRSLHATSAGKAVLGSLDAAALEEFLRTDKLVPMTENTIRSPDALREEIATSNKRGWFLNEEESVISATTISARFFYAKSTYVVTVAGPTVRMKSKIDHAAQLLLQVCRDLDEATGESAGLDSLAART